MSHDLTGQRVLVIGGAKNLGLAVAKLAASSGADVVLGARDDALATQEATALGGTAIHLDLTDEESIAAAAAQLGGVDHIVITASAHHNVPVADIERDKAAGAFDAKIIGPLLVAKHFAPLMPTTGSILLFSGVAAWNPSAGAVIMGVTNGAVSFLATHLATELAPLRVNALSPGIIDSGTWDDMDAADRNALFEGGAKGSLAGRVGTRDDIADAAVWILGNTYISGETIHIEGGARH